MFGSEVAALSRNDLRPGYFTHLLSAAYTETIESFDAVDYGTTCCAAVVKTAAPVVIDDTNDLSNGPICPMMQAEGLKSYLGVPVFLNGVAIGALEVMHRHPNPWKKHDILSLIKLARVAEAFLDTPRSALNATRLRVVT